MSELRTIVVDARTPEEAQRPECESVRGEWGGICPDCGQRLPSLPGPLMARVAPVMGRPPRPGAFGINR